VPDAAGGRTATASVLVQHARGRVEDAYAAFRLAARQVGARAGTGTGQSGFLLDDPSLEKMLLEVCGEDTVGTGTVGEASN
jgi:hypothetical protein